MLYLHCISKSTACYLYYDYFSKSVDNKKSVLENIMFGLDQEACLARYEFEHQQIYKCNLSQCNQIEFMGKDLVSILKSISVTPTLFPG